LSVPDIDVGQPDVKEIYTVTIDPITGKIIPFFKSIEIQLKKCDLGDSLKESGECLKCPPSQYLLEVPELPMQCKRCIDKAECRGGNILGPIEGYWRPSNNSEVIETCPNFDSCL
jgi:hypothetical protein